MSISSKILERINNQQSEPLWEMANLGSKTTGLPVYVFVSVRMHSSGPRIKVGKSRSSFRNKRENFSVSISNTPSVVAGSADGIVNPSELKLIFDWIVLNRDVLLRYWNDDLDTEDMIRMIEKV